MNEILYVVAVHSNPAGFSIRAKLFNNWLAHMATFSGIQVVAVELSYDGNWEVTEANNPYHIRLLGNDSQKIWQKEALINIGVSRLPHNWKYVAWVDADIEFMNRNWVNDTINLLQTNKVVQLWGQAIKLGPKGELLDTEFSFIYCYRKKLTEERDYKHFWHCGYAWATTRDTFDAVGGLIDWCITGSGDHQMAWAFLGNVWKSVPNKLNTPSYVKKVLTWQDRARNHIGDNIAMVPGTLVHFYHGLHKNRGYETRWKILFDNLYDPDIDIVKDYQGVPTLVGNKPDMNRRFLEYFHNRQEDDGIKTN